MMASTEPLGDRRFALLLAVSQYVDPTLNRLRAPAADAVALRDLLADPEVGGFAVTSVFDEKAQAMRLAVEEFLADRSPDDIVLVYLSCHGLVDLRRRLYFAARDTLKNRLASSGVEAHWLLDQLEDCRARRQVVILDCCFSGAFAQGTKGDTDLGLGERLMGQGRGRVVLTASRGTEYSFEGEPVEGAAPQGSVFTSALVAGIVSGEADTDNDGYISVDDAYSFAFEQVRNAGAGQTPQRWLYGAEGSIVLARRPVPIGSTTHVAPEPPPTPATASTSSVGATAAAGGDVREPSPPGRSRRWLVGAAAAVLVAGAAAIGAWALNDGDDDDGGGGGGGDGSSANQLEVTAPWRLIVRDKSNSGGGCDVTVTDDEGNQAVNLEGLYGDNSFQMQTTGRVTWDTNDPGCLVFQQPGAGDVAVPFASPCCQGDTDGFAAGDQVVVEIVDWNGNSSCEIVLSAISDGRPLDFGTLEEGAETLILETFGASPVYVADHNCGLRISSPG
jgi:Caspase domain